jgi:hypothetical protein
MPPPTTPRLANLNPAAVAGEVVRLVVGPLEHHGGKLRPTRRAGVEDPQNDLGALANTDLGLKVQDLTLYAQTGELGNWDDLTGPHDAVQDVCTALSPTVGDPGSFGLGDLAELDETANANTPIGVVLVAAWARVSIADGNAVTIPGLAALTGVSRLQVEHLVTAGELEPLDPSSQPRRFKAEEARRFLEARGVPGFSKRAS